MVNHRNLAWCIWHEDLYSDIMQTQVYPVLRGLSNSSNVKVYLFWVCHAWGASIKTPEFLAAQASLSQMKVKLVRLPIILLPRRLNLFFMHWITSILLLPITFSVLSVLIHWLRIGTLHLRSYPAMPASLLLNIFFRGRKIVFDTRSPFPEECVQSGRWKLGSCTYKYWKTMEGFAVKYFHTTIVVSKAHKMLLCKSNNILEKKVVVLRNNADADLVKINSMHGKIEDTYFAADFIQFVYIGSFSKNGWNDPYIYSEMIADLIAKNFNFHCFFVTKNPEILIQSMISKSIPQHYFSVATCAAQDVVGLIPKNSIGLNLMKHADVRMSIKTAEYISAGIPFICTNTVVGAAELIEEFDLGRVVFSIDQVGRAAVEINLNRSSIRSGLARAQLELSTKTLVKNLLKIYNASGPVQQ